MDQIQLSLYIYIILVVAANTLQKESKLMDG